MHAKLGMNVNGGKKIFVRVRKPGDEQNFFDLGFITGTLLHELVHIVHGPHNVQFHNLLEEITTECESGTAIFSGNSYQNSAKARTDNINFDGAGYALGTNNTNRDTAKNAALLVCDQYIAFC